jgi:hypothetical protein
MQSLSDEQRLLGAIQKTPPGPERDALIEELEQAPVHYRTFYDRWLFVHNVSPYWDCWSDAGYDPTQSKFPRDIQLLAATNYGKSDIDNGGLHQFFGNGTGTFAPEMQEWFERAGLSESGAVIAEAMTIFGPDFQRSHQLRRDFLDQFREESRWQPREEYDPFIALDSRFYAATPNDVFDAAANAWLKDVCGIRRLRDNASVA